MKYCQNHTHYPTNRVARSVLLLASVVLLCFVLIHPIGPASAVTDYKGKALGIIIEKSCLLSDKCVNYGDILYLDNSIAKYSGGFTLDGKDNVKRLPVSYKNPLGYYTFDKTFRIFIDPPKAYENKIPIIEIRTKLDEFHLQGQDKVTELKTNKDAKATESIRTWSKTRYVDDGCRNAIITAKDWKTVLPDTIEYLKHNCDPSYTKIITITNEIKPLTKHDLSTSYKWKFDNWQAEIIKNCTKQRNSCSDLKQPTRGGL